MSAGPIWEMMVQIAAGNLLQHLAVTMEFIGIILLLGAAAWTIQTFWRSTLAP